MASRVKDSRPTWGQVRAAQLLVEQARKGLAPEPSERIKQLAKATPRPRVWQNSGDPRPTWGQVRAAQLLVEQARKGLAPEQSERIKRLAKATPRNYD